MTHLVQYLAADGVRAVGLVEGPRFTRLASVASVYDLAFMAIDRNTTLDAMAAELLGEVDDYVAIVDEGRLLSPLDHPDPAHCLVSGTGLTHLGSAAARGGMHAGADSANETDSMKMFRWGIEGGRPADGTVGALPEWFYKGDGSAVVAPGAALPLPDFARDGGEEPELVGLYINDGDGRPRRLGFALGNEFSDHVTEKGNYLWLAHSKLRACSFGPELVTGAAPQHICGLSEVLDAQGRPRWQAEFLTGESNMSHSIANLEHHHFKYPQFRRPGDVHVHFFGTATLSFAAGISVAPGESFRISAAGFGAPLVNPMMAQEGGACEVVRL